MQHEDELSRTALIPFAMLLNYVFATYACSPTSFHFYGFKFHAFHYTKRLFVSNHFCLTRSTTSLHPNICAKRSDARWANGVWTRPRIGINGPGTPDSRVLAIKGFKFSGLDREKILARHHPASLQVSILRCGCYDCCLFVCAPPGSSQRGFD